MASAELPVNAKLVGIALIIAGGEAPLRAIYDQVRANLPDWALYYKNEDTLEATVRSTIESHCPQSEKYRAGTEALFERTARGRYRVVPPEERVAVIQRGRSL